MSPAEVLGSLDNLIAQAPPEDRPGLIVALAARLAQLGAGLVKLAPTSEDANTNLSAVEAARRLGLSKDWLYRNAATLPFALRIGRRVVFNAVGLEKWTRVRMGR